MSVKIFWLHKYPNSSLLGIMARPRGADWLEGEIMDLHKQNVQVVVSLLEHSEIYELGLQEEPELCSKHHIEYLNFPIPDRSIPSNNTETKRLINSLIDKSLKGTNVVIHCRMGIGRSSIIAGSILLRAGYKADDIIPHISRIRGLSVPDTDQQTAWLKSQKKS